VWTGKPLDSIWRGTGQAGVDLVLGTRILGGDTAAKTLTDDHGNVYGYDKLLLATGGAPRCLPGAPDRVIYFRTLDDYQHLRVLAEIVEDWKDPFRQGVVYYLKAGRVRGVLLWNTWGQVDAARHLIAGRERYSATSLAGLIHD